MLAGEGACHPLAKALEDGCLNAPSAFFVVHDEHPAVAAVVFRRSLASSLLQWQKHWVLGPLELGDGKGSVWAAGASSALHVRTWSASRSCLWSRRSNL